MSMFRGLTQMQPRYINIIAETFHESNKDYRKKERGFPEYSRQRSFVSLNYSLINLCYSDCGLTRRGKVFRTAFFIIASLSLLFTVSPVSCFLILFYFIFWHRKLYRVSSRKYISSVYWMFAHTRQEAIE